jgi:hypothetical protein
MCQYEKCTEGYGTAYAGSESVTLSMQLYCDRCREASLLTARTHIHFGGEIWQPAFACEKCGWAIVVTVKPGTVFLGRKR